MRMGDAEIGSASVEVSRTDCDRGACYLLEARESYRPRGAVVERHARAVVRPDLVVESASEVVLRRHDVVARSETALQSDGDHREVRHGGADKAAVEYRCADGALHRSATFLAMLLVGDAKPRTYEFETCWGPEDPTPTAFEFGDRAEVTVGGARRTLQGAELVIVRPRPVGFLAPPPDPPVLEEPLWFDPERGTPVVWSRQDDAGPLRFELRADDDQPVAVGATAAEACTLASPTDAALCYLLSAQAGDPEAALAAVDLPRYAAYALANVPGLATSIEAQGSHFGADEARDLVEGKLEPLRCDAGEVAIPLSEHSFTVATPGEHRVVLAPVPGRVELPDAEVTRLVVERDPGGGRWRLVYVGRDAVQVP